MAKNIRNVAGQNVQDPSTISNLQYNDAAGSQKISEVGRHLLPLTFLVGSVLTYTTDASTQRALPRKGCCLAVYNKDTVVRAVTLGEDSTVVALAAGITDAAGHVGIPCAPGAWVYVACGLQNWVITDNANLAVFLIDDNSTITQEVSR